VACVDSNNTGTTKSNITTLKSDRLNDNADESSKNDVVQSVEEDFQTGMPDMNWNVSDIDFMLMDDGSFMDDGTFMDAGTESPNLNDNDPHNSHGSGSDSRDNGD
jgi:hypothetical protein